MPAVGHVQPSRFLSSGQSAVPPICGGLAMPPSGRHIGGGGSLMKNDSADASAVAASRIGTLATGFSMPLSRPPPSRAPASSLGTGGPKAPLQAARHAIVKQHANDF